MRLFATLLLLVVAAIYLHLGGVQADNKYDKNKFSYNNGQMPNIKAYIKLLEELRDRLASGTDVHGILVTRPARNIPLQERFIQVELQNSGYQVITVIIDTVNVYVVGYLVSSPLAPILHYLDGDASEALRDALPNTTYIHRPLNFDGRYRSLPDRDQTPLGHGALNDAIRNLYYGQSQRSALLVIIQMVAEAVRIRHIEHLILRNMYDERNPNFIPDTKAINLENSWDALSTQIQSSCESGVFLREVRVQIAPDPSSQLRIRNVEESMALAALALMLYKTKPTAIRMPVPVPVPVAVGADEQCPYGEPTTNIIGRDGQCMDVKENQYGNGNPIILFPCGNAQRNQLWTFKSDGTIRSNGKCLTTSGNYIMIFDCDLAPETTKWILHNAGTIMNPRLRLVIAAESSTPRTVLTAAVDSNSSRQAWSAGNYTQPTITYISGFLEMCLQANGENARVWLANCVIDTEPRQQWAIYGDRTIRLYSDRTLCVTSDGHESVDSIILFKCQGSEAQRWTFMADATILNPYAQLVMDVRGSDVSLQEIILYPPTGNPNQKWLAF
nr:ribosome-inactivating protein [Tanacetum cinerariifolium]